MKKSDVGMYVGMFFIMLSIFGSGFVVGQDYCSSKCDSYYHDLIMRECPYCSIGQGINHTESVGGDLGWQNMNLSIH